MHSEHHPGHRFEKLVADLFRRIWKCDVRSNVTVPGELGHDFEVDIFIDAPSNRTVAEVKLYRYSSPPPVGTFVRALRQIQQIKRTTLATIGILVISCPLTPKLAEAAQAHDEIEVWDANSVFTRASEFPDLLREFEQLFEVSAPLAPEFLKASQENLGYIAIAKDGQRLADRLKEISPGRPEARAFEDACINALRYLFEADLHGWYEQLDTEDGPHRRDLVCRILPKSEVWRLMLDDLHSRYVVFEFKNYSEPITQHEVVTTERYLYPSALRNVAIIISPEGCANSADKVIRGAMREHGKLVISLTVAEIETLLISKDDGADPNTYLFQRVDDFLLSLGR
ncbi:restriction endonuclease [Cupriavidus sp. KB_39]|uniref:restriction endonuclease n=1 Tax=Cupriavidus sp. KB_39 TaxID=3233036 RepID=UPI003F8E86D9